MADQETMLFDPASEDVGVDTKTRTRIVDAAIEAVRDEGRAGLRAAAVGMRAGTDEAAVRRHFPTEDSLRAATVARWHESRVLALVPIASEHGTIAFLRGLLEVGQDDPRLARLLVDTLVDESDESQPIAAFYRRQYALFQRALRIFMTADIVAGRQPRHLHDGQAADECLALYEGVQLQALLRDRVDTLALFDRAATHLQRGWRTPDDESLDAEELLGTDVARVLPNGGTPPPDVVHASTILRIAMPGVRLRSDDGSVLAAADGDTLILPATGTYTLRAG